MLKKGLKFAHVVELARPGFHDRLEYPSGAFRSEKF